VSKKFCVLPIGFSENCALDCKRRHRHMTLKEVKIAEADGDIKFLDLDPQSNWARYIFTDRGHNTQRTHLTASVIRNASGAYSSNETSRDGRSHWLEAGRAETAAQDKIADYYRVWMVELKNFAWDDQGMTAGFKSDRFNSNHDASGRLIEGHDWLPKGTPLRIALKPRTPHIEQIALSLWRFIEVRAISIEPPEDYGESAEPSRGPFRRTNSGGFKMRGRVPRKTFFSEQREALRQLELAWPQIVAEFFAGPYSDDLNSTRPGELPSMILTETLRAYLEIDSDRWKEIEGKR
jgi:hypothetical protein